MAWQYENTNYLLNNFAIAVPAAAENPTFSAPNLALYTYFQDANWRYMQIYPQTDYWPDFETSSVWSFGITSASFFYLYDPEYYGNTNFNYVPAGTWTLSFNVADVNEWPTDIYLSNTTVAENATDTVIGTLTATDPDTSASGYADPFSYSLVDESGNTLANSPFVIDGDVLKVGSTGFDYEAGGSVRVYIKVSDSGSLWNWFYYDIDITNVSGATITGTNAADVINGSTTVASQPLPTDEEDVINGAGGHDTIDGLGGNDKINGGYGNDTLNGGAGYDVLSGGGGNDTLNGGGGIDSLRGGANDDTYIVDQTGARIVELTDQGIDTVIASLSTKLAAHVENLQLTGSAAINGTGNDLDNTIIGNDLINTLNGMDGNDTLNGGLGDDRLYGGVGEDTLLGGAGCDRLSGGADNDVFKYAALSDSGITSATRDIVMDYNAGDVFDLTGLGFTQFIEGGTFTAAGQLRQYAWGANTVIAGNTDSDGAAEFQIVLIGTHTLQDSDFLL